MENPVIKRKPATVLRCVKFTCDNARLVIKKPGQSMQTQNGFFTIQVAGHYCPVCGASYG